MALLLIGMQPLAFAAPPLVHATINGEVAVAHRNNLMFEHAGNDMRIVPSNRGDQQHLEQQHLDNSAVSAPARLDLRLPDDSRLDAYHDHGANSIPARSTGTESDANERFRDMSDAYAKDAKSQNLLATAERIRRDGVSVAHLWENKSALVSLGFNGHGKPGIWLVQKVH